MGEIVRVRGETWKAVGDLAVGDVVYSEMGAEVEVVAVGEDREVVGLCVAVGKDGFLRCGYELGVRGFSAAERHKRRRKGVCGYVDGWADDAEPVWIGQTLSQGFAVPVCGPLDGADRLGDLENILEAYRDEYGHHMRIPLDVGKLFEVFDVINAAGKTGYVRTYRKGYGVTLPKERGNSITGKHRIVYGADEVPRMVVRDIRVDGGMMLAGRSMIPVVAGD